MKLYKLTDKNKITHGTMVWGEKVTNSIPSKKEPELCTPDVIHAYKNLNLALLLNPIHANYSTPLIWEAEGEVVCQDWDKVGVFSLTTIKQLTTPDWIGVCPEKVSVCFAILCAKAVIKIFEAYYPWDLRPQLAIMAAEKYLCVAAYAADAADAANAAAYAAYTAADVDAAHAAHAAYAAADAAYAAHAVHAAVDAVDAAHAVHAAADAAYTAADAAYAAHASHAAHAAYAAAHAADIAHAAHAAHAAAHASHAAVHNVEFDVGTLADKAVEIVMKGELI